MSGKWNNPRIEKMEAIQMNSKWIVFEHQNKGAGKYQKYRSQLVIVAQPTGDLGVTEAGCKALGTPSHVVCVTDGSGRWGLAPANADTAYAYKLSFGNPKRPGYLRRVSAKPFSERLGLIAEKEIRIYQAYMDDGVLVVNMSQKPSIIKV